jgi:hypothetical protein
VECRLSNMNHCLCANGCLNRRDDQGAEFRYDAAEAQSGVKEPNDWQIDKHGLVSVVILLKDDPLPSSLSRLGVSILQQTK